MDAAPVKRHKVLLFVPNLQQGGAERQILELMTRLPPRFEATLCLYEDVVHYREYLPPGEPRHILGARRMGPRGLRRLVEVLQQEKPDILHSYRDKANFWARLAARARACPSSSRPCAAAPCTSSTWRRSGGCPSSPTASSPTRRRASRAGRPGGRRAGEDQILHNFIDVEVPPPDAEERARGARRWNLAEGQLALLLPGRIGLAQTPGRTDRSPD